MNSIKPKTENTTPEEIEELVNDVADFTCSHSSKNFYRKAILSLGTGLVREAVGEVRMRQASGEIDNPAKYLTTVLQNWMAERGLSRSTSADPERALAQNTFSILDVRSDTTRSKNDEVRTLEVPFSPDFVQWLLFLGPEYFTLTNEKALSDRVASTRIECRGKLFHVPMLRGKFGRNDKERGILTCEHMRVMGAVERIWADQKGPHTLTGGRCVVNASVRQIAAYMGIGTSGREYKRIAEKVRDLGGTGYCYLLSENEELKAMGFDDLSFQFFGETPSITMIENGRQCTYFQIVFSKMFSAALLSRSKVVVSRPLELLRTRGDIAFKLAVYLFRILKKHDSHEIELNALIERLELKRTGWSAKPGYKSLRKREFEKAIRELQGMPSGDGKTLAVDLVEALDGKDFILFARFK